MAGHTRTRTGCWTCRESGYKCDEQKPHCGRCIRLNKDCKGYGLKLKWRNASVTAPSHQRAKRDPSIDSSAITNPELVLSPLSSMSTGSAAAKLDNVIQERALRRSLTQVAMPSLAPDLPPADQHLLHYWINHLSTIISVTPRKNHFSPFQVHLAPIAYSYGALRSTVLAMAANHLFQVSNDRVLRVQGYRHQRDAIHLLQELIQDPHEAASDPALATVLMMQVSARLFEDEDEAHVANHLIGAKEMIARRNSVPTWRTSYNTHFLLSLFAYHDILSSVSRGSRPLVNHESDFSALEGAQSMESIARVLRAVARISKLHDLAKSQRAASKGSSLSGSTHALGAELEKSLLETDFPTTATRIEDTCDIALTAQAYLHAAFIYLYRVWLDVGAPNPTTLNHVQFCLTCVEQVPVDSSLTSAHIWPLFTAGCEAVDSVQRQFVRKRFEEMYASRKFPSLRRVMRDIEDVWATKDMEHATNALDGMSKVDCIQVILRRRGREVDLT